jgi:hypothetical protein
MYVHWNKRTIRVIIELTEKEAESLRWVLDATDLDLLDEEEERVLSHLHTNLHELDTTDKRPGI